APAASRRRARLARQHRGARGGVPGRGARCNLGRHAVRGDRTRALRARLRRIGARVGDVVAHRTVDDPPPSQGVEMIIVLTPSGQPASDQIRDQIRGLVTAGRLAADQRLPSVRQLAADLGVAPGTVAKAYRALEAEGVLVTRVGAGTRVDARAQPTPAAVLEAARRLADTSRRAGTDVEEAIAVLRAIWPDDRQSM